MLHTIRYATWIKPSEGLLNLLPRTAKKCSKLLKRDQQPRFKNECTDTRLNMSIIYEDKNSDTPDIWYGNGMVYQNWFLRNPGLEYYRDTFHYTMLWIAYTRTNEGDTSFCRNYCQNIGRSIQQGIPSMPMVCEGDRATTLPLDQYKGGSKDSFTLYMYECPNKDRGYNFIHRYMIEIEQHLMSCNHAILPTNQTQMCEKCEKKIWE